MTKSPFVGPATAPIPAQRAPGCQGVHSAPVASAVAAGGAESALDQDAEHVGAFAFFAGGLGEDGGQQVGRQVEGGAERARRARRGFAGSGAHDWGALVALLVS